MRRRPLALVLSTCAAFALTAFGLGRVAPYPEMGDLDDKLRFFEAHRNDYDTLFFGSSRVLRGVMPEVFDAEMDRRGVPVRSFNFGIDGMEGHETAALVRRVLAMEPARLRRVVVELPEEGALGAELHPENRLKARTVFWHDAEETWAAIAGRRSGSARGGERWRQAVDHLLHGLANATAAGGGRHLLREVRDRFGPPPGAYRRPLDPVELSRTGGFEPFGDSAYRTPSTHPFRRHFLRVIPQYRHAVAGLAAANRTVPPAPVPPSEVAGEVEPGRLVARLSKSIRRAGAEPVFLVTPTARPTPELYRLAAAGRVPLFVAFNDPGTYPELFRVEHRFDADHLTTDGARRFSRRLAEHLARPSRPAAAGADRLLADRSSARAAAPASLEGVSASAGSR